MWQLSKTVKATAAYIVKQVFAFVTATKGKAEDGDKAAAAARVSTLSFADFGQWYNVEGHSVAPWIELLDVRKWKNM